MRCIAFFHPFLSWVLCIQRLIQGITSWYEKWYLDALYQKTIKQHYCTLVKKWTEIKIRRNHTCLKQQLLRNGSDKNGCKVRAFWQHVLVIQFLLDNFSGSHCHFTCDMGCLLLGSNSMKFRVNLKMPRKAAMRLHEQRIFVNDKSARRAHWESWSFLVFL